MRQLNVFCEGQTEQAFCAQVLQPHLFRSVDGMIHTLAVGEKNNHHLFGLGKRTKYDRVRKFIQNTIKQKQNKDVYFTTFFDLYALPDDFPGTAVNSKDTANPTPYVRALEQAFENDINHHRFIAHLQLYEYETVLFSDPQAFAISFESCSEQIKLLETITKSVSSIEHINDGPDTAPSKRIINIFPQYRGRKTTAGPDIAEHIGIEKIRTACPHFHHWLTSLERIPWSRE